MLVGDFLYSRAFQLMVESIGQMRVMDVMADATNTIAEGEVLQLMNCRNPDTTEDQYLEVIYRKTAKLFEAGVLIGSPSWPTRRGRWTMRSSNTVNNSAPRFSSSTTHWTTTRIHDAARQEHRRRPGRRQSRPAADLCPASLRTPKEQMMIRDSDRG